ncbi:hypothetical protein Tco_1261656 [Tanacetum coccineum]
MVIPDNQVGSPKSVLDGKALEDSSNCSNFDLDLYLNDEEDNGDNVVVLQTSSEIPNEHLDGDALDPWIPALEQGDERSRGSKYNGIYSLFYKYINLPLKGKDTTFLI